MQWLRLLGISGSVTAGIGAAALTYALWIEPFRIQFEQITLRLPRAAGRLPKQGLRILHLSDSHFHGAHRIDRERAKIARIRQLTAGLYYDLLVHTGDFWHDDAGIDHVLELLHAVPRPRLGSYGVFGNHDYYHFGMATAPLRMWRTFNAKTPLSQATPVSRLRHLWRFFLYFRDTPLDGPPTVANDAAMLQRELEGWGMTILHNRAERLAVNSAKLPVNGVNRADEPLSSNRLPSGDWPIALQVKMQAPSVHSIAARRTGVQTDSLDLYLAGIDDYCEGSPNLQQALQDVPEDAPLLLLSHNPDVLQDPAVGRVDVMLSGHTHGGQLVLPVWGPAHTQSASLRRHEAAGYLQRGRTQVYISRGLGEGIPLRFRAHPQITLVTLKA